MPLTICGIKYYTIREIAIISGANTRTLRRWVANGDLDDIIHKYRAQPKSPMLFRLEPPDETDVLWTDTTDVYHLPAKEGLL